MTKTSGWPGEAQVRVDQHAAGAIDGSSQRFPQGRGRHPGGPENDGRGQAGRAHDYGGGFDAGDQGRGANFNPQLTQLFFGTAGQVFRISGQYARTAFEKDDAGAFGIDGVKLIGQNAARNLSQGAGQLDPGRATAHNHEIELHLARAAGRVTFGQLKRQQDAAADFNGVFNGLETRRQGLPFVVAEIGVAGAGGHDQIVVGDLQRPTT